MAEDRGLEPQRRNAASVSNGAPARAGFVFHSRNTKESNLSPEGAPVFEAGDSPLSRYVP